MQPLEARGESERDRGLLQHQGVRVLRFWNNDVLTNLDGVVTSIMNALPEGPHHSSLQMGEG